jgi:hypothetical protein
MDDYIKQNMINNTLHIIMGVVLLNYGGIRKLFIVNLKTKI